MVKVKFHFVRNLKLKNYKGWLKIMYDKKLLVEVYATYPKQGGDDLIHQELIVDSKVNRQRIVDQWLKDDVIFNMTRVEKFVLGKINVLEYAKDVGEWENPEGGYIALFDYASKIKACEERYLENIKHIRELFDEVGLTHET